MNTIGHFSNIDNDLIKAEELLNNHNYSEADRILLGLIDINSQNAEIYYLLSYSAYLQQETKKALVLIQKAIDLNSIEKYFMKAAYYFITSSDNHNAIKYYKIILDNNPNNVIAYTNLGVAYSKIKEYNKAISCYESALEIEPNNANALCNCGTTLKLIQKIDKALEYFNKSISINPNHIDSILNIGAVYSQNLGMPERAIEYYNKILKENPNHANACINIRISYLLAKDFTSSWKYNEYRFHGLTVSSPKVHRSKPKWQGEPIKDKIIYVYYEQGIGDTIQFVKFLSLLKKFKPKKILFKPQEGLDCLLKNSCIDIDIDIIDYNTPDDILEFDYYVSLFDVLKYLKLEYKDIPKPKKYLKADINKTVKYKANLFKGEKFKIGLFWQGNPVHCLDEFRSVKLSIFSKLFELKNVDFYSLQKGFGEEQLSDFAFSNKVTNLSKYLTDFSETASIIDCLDLVITVDSAIAHLAGAMGKKTWVILPSIYEWRWFNDENKTIWYENMTLFRPKLNQNKSEIIEIMYKKLHSLLNDQ